MSETLSPPPKAFRVVRWIITIGAPLGVVFLTLLLFGVTSDPSMTPAQMWGDLLLMVVLLALVVRSWVRPNHWLSTTQFALIGLGISRILMGVLLLFESGPGAGPIFWVLAGLAFVASGWAGLQGVRRGQNPFAALRRRPKDQ